MEDAPKREINDYELKQRLAGAYEEEAQIFKATDNVSRSHETAACDFGGPIRTVDQEVRYSLQNLINVKMTRIDRAQQEAVEAEYLRALFDSLPTRMSHDAAMGLKLLVKHYGNSPSRY